MLMEWRSVSPARSSRQRRPSLLPDPAALGSSGRSRLRRVIRAAWSSARKATDRGMCGNQDRFHGLSSCTAAKGSTNRGDRHGVGPVGAATLKDRGSSLMTMVVGVVGRRVHRGARRLAA